MNNNSRRFRGKLSNKIPFRRVFLIGFMLLISLGSPGQVALTKASPAQQATNITKRFYLNFHAPAVICVGTSAPLNVTPLVELNGTMSSGQPFDYQDRIIQGITITPTIQDTNIATVTPTSGKSGALTNSGDIFGTATFGTIAGLGEVPFKITGKKPGVTNLYVKANIPGQLTGSTNSDIISAVTFRVTYCKYKVTATSKWTFNAPNLHSVLLSTLSGTMELKDQSGESTSLSGTADVNWDLSSFSAMCSHSHVIAKDQGHLNGTLNPDDTLTVNVTYDPFNMNTANCASGSVGSFQAPPFATTVSSITGGGSKNVPVAFTVGNMPVKGSVTINVSPVPSK